MIYLKFLARRLYPAIALVLVWSCGTTPSAGPQITGLSLTPNPSGRVPLAAVVTLSTDEPARITVRVDDGDRSWDIRPSDALETNHELMVLGLGADRSHAFTVIAEDAAGARTESEPLSYATPALPDELPNLRVTVREPARMEPGVTLFNVKHWNEERQEQHVGLLVMVDDSGEVVWYYRNEDDAIEDSRRLSNGNVLALNSPTGELWEMMEIDMLGNIVQRWHATGTPQDVVEGSTLVDIDTFHHEVVELSSGNFLALSSETRVIENYPTSDTDPDAPRSPSTVIGDVLVEFSRDGTIIRQWSLLDILDPYRITPSSLGGGFYRNTYVSVEGLPLRDWAHSNALAYDASEDSAVLSLRNQSALVKIDMASGELDWILGTPAGWRVPWSDALLEPVGELDWMYYQHGPSFTPDGNIVLFDNGDSRAIAFEEPLPMAERYSRVVEYAVSEDTMEVSQAWVYGGSSGEDSFHSRYLSDADWLPVTGNVLITDGARETDAAGTSVAPDDARRWARIVEVTHTEPAEKVFELLLEEDPGFGVHVYRAQRLPDLYP